MSKAKRQVELPTTIVTPVWLGKVSKSSVSEDEIREAKEQIEKDPTYNKNGWSPEKLAMYFKERKTAQSDRVLHRPAVRPKVTNGWHNAHRWRKR